MDKIRIAALHEPALGDEITAMSGRCLVLNADVFLAG